MIGDKRRLACWAPFHLEKAMIGRTHNEATDYFRWVDGVVAYGRYSWTTVVARVQRTSTSLSACKFPSYVRTAAGER
eukprot:6657623-Prymnesium_polylepis.1